MVDMLYMHISTWRTQVQILVPTNFNKHHMGRTATKKKNNNNNNNQPLSWFSVNQVRLPIWSGYDNYNKPQF